MVDILFPVDVSLTVCGGWTILVGQIIVIAANLSGAFPSRIIVADGVLTDAPCLGFVALGINALDAVRKLHLHRFEWTKPESGSRYYSDVLLGTDKIRKQLCDGSSVKEVIEIGRAHV